MKTPLSKLQKLELISSAKNAAASKRAAFFAEEHLFEIEKRRLHIEAGYSSLHEFTVAELNYSDGAAYRRISAMRLITKVPEASEIQTRITFYSTPLPIRKPSHSKAMQI